VISEDVLLFHHAISKLWTLVQVFKMLLMFEVFLKRSRYKRISIRWSVSRLTVHLVWVTKYRYKVLTGDIQKRCRELLIQVCDAEDVRILSGVVSKDHIHIHVEYPPSVSISNLVKRMKGRASRLLQKEFPVLSKRYWGKHLWGIGYGAWSTGNITEEIVQEYLKRHKSSSNDTEDFKLD
jgi:putative transposase